MPSNVATAHPADRTPVPDKTIVSILDDVVLPLLRPADASTTPRATSPGMIDVARVRGC
ncbi:MAG: hypothetical protein ACRDTA_20690 [Pseudonocardiaceae bacterium]